MPTAKLHRHPSHDHPLVPWDFRLQPFSRNCDLCRRRISSEAYTCRVCKSFHFHRACVEAPPHIENHPLHPLHPLALLHGRPYFKCDACNELFSSGSSSFCCDGCGFNLDICCALSMMSDQGGSPGGGETAEQITIPHHPHQFTFFSMRNDFVGDRPCTICSATVDGDGYMCLARYCEFIIHKSCIQDLYYADGTKAPRVFHGHPLEILVGEDVGSSICGFCGSNGSKELIGCPSCRVFYHRDCVQVPDILHYPPHHQDHTLVLFINCSDDHKLRCGSCSNYMKGELYYRCTSCAFLVHVRCALQTIAYCNEGMSASIQWPWHEHPLLLSHKTKSGSDYCNYCEDELSGPTYMCSVRYCQFLLHERCSGIQSTMTHPHHPDHLLTLRSEADDQLPLCKACCKTIVGFHFSCESCTFLLHSGCAARLPTQKHFLHEHGLLYLEEAWSWECNRCRSITDSPFFRCVRCDFNIHEKCMEVPRVVKSEVHWHSLTLLESYVEDETGEYYCEHCEKRRDHRLGVYVCLQCQQRWTYHIDCILPKLQNFFEKKSLTPVIERLNEQIARKHEEVHAAEVELEEMKRELDELEKEREGIISREEHYEDAIEDESMQEEYD